jgi:type IV pilus assembly protein PilM
VLDSLRKLIEDPPPPYAFEVSQAGIAWARRLPEAGSKLETGFVPLAGDVLAVSPVQDNVLQPEAFAQAVMSLATINGMRKTREAALILPDFSTRVAVLDFEQFPSDRDEQMALVRFRLKKTVPFDMDTASINYHVRQYDGRWYAVAAASAVEIVARYEAAFRGAGFLPGFVTTSALAAMDLVASDPLVVAAKLSGRVLTVSVSEGARLRLLRCMELGDTTLEEVMGVLYPTMAYAEDELPKRPGRLLLCGFGPLASELADVCAADLQLTVEPLRSVIGSPDATNAGLYGYLQANGVN